MANAVSKIIAAQNDYGYTITFNVKHKDGTSMDLTDSTVNMRAKIEIPSFVVVSRTCTIGVPATMGVCAYTVEQGDFTQAGIYNIELVINNTALDKVITAQGLALTIHQRKT